jgi:hypothetical protein
MRRCFDKKIIFCFLLFFQNVTAQKIYLSDELDRAMQRHCAICSKELPAFYNPVLVDVLFGPSDKLFHASHTSLRTGHLDEAYRHASATIHSLGDSSPIELYIYSTFLQAKLDEFNSETSAAIDKYEQFLLFNSSDLVVTGDAYNSLTGIYRQRKNWAKVEQYLERFNGFLIYQKKT